MITFIPKPIFNKGITIYFVSLALVTIVFFNYAMDFQFFLIGISFILLFFLRTQRLSITLSTLPPKAFAKKIFLTALLIRIFWVIFSYFFFIANTDQPFEWGTADAMGYHEEAKWLAEEDWSIAFSLWKGRGISDTGYAFYLTVLYKILGPNIIIARLFKSLFSAITCVLIYKLTSRTFAESTGRIAGLFAVFMPNLIIYCGLHLKETEMLFCTLMFLERTDYLFRSHHFTFKTIAIPTIFALILFTFRTVLGMTAFLSFFTAFILDPHTKIFSGKKFLTSLWIIAVLAVFVGGRAMTEIEGVMDRGTDDQRLKREEQTSRGAKWAKYATGTVMAPMIFVVPFSTMIDTDQPNQNLIHAGTFIKNFLGIFVLFALFYAIKLHKWRDFSLLGSYTIVYLMIIAFSGFANAERFHLPALPGILMMAAYGLSQLNKQNLKYVNYWCLIVVLMEFSWAFFKLGSRGIVSL